jgi:hypothetical protein
MVVALVGIALLSGCALLEPPWFTGTPSESAEPPSPQSGPVTVLETTAGLPPEFPNFPGSADAEAGLAYVDSDDPTVLMLMIYGSSSCPYLPSTYRITPTGGLTLIVDEDFSEGVLTEFGYACTADNAATSTVFAFPDDVIVPDEVTIEDVGHGFAPITIPVWDAPSQCAAIHWSDLWCQEDALR